MCKKGASDGGGEAKAFSFLKMGPRWESLMTQQCASDALEEETGGGGWGPKREPRAGLRKGSQETRTGGAEEHAFDIARGFPVLPLFPRSQKCTASCDLSGESV